MGYGIVSVGGAIRALERVLPTAEEAARFWAFADRIVKHEVRGPETAASAAAYARRGLVRRDVCGGMVLEIGSDAYYGLLFHRVYQALQCAQFKDLEVAWCVFHVGYMVGAFKMRATVVIEVMKEIRSYMKRFPATEECPSWYRQNFENFGYTSARVTVNEWTLPMSLQLRTLIISQAQAEIAETCERHRVAKAVEEHWRRLIEIGHGITGGGF